MVDFKEIIQEVNKQQELSFQACIHTEEDGSPYAAAFSCEKPPYGIFTVAFKKTFPYTLPDVFIKYTAASHLHVETNGKVCLTDQSSLLIDPDRPVQLVLDCLELAEQSLSIASDSPKYSEELKKEFLSYWGLQKTKIICFSIFRIPKEERLIQEFPLFPLFPSDNTLLLTNTIYDANCYLCDVLGFGPQAEVKKPAAQALVIRLKKESVLPSPFKRYDWSSIMLYISTNTDRETYHEFLEQTSPSVRRHTLNIVFILPDANADILFGVKVLFINAHRMPMKASRTNHVWQVNIIRNDYDFLLSRGGASPSLKDKKVLLLGCGSVGGFIANNLCQMGITQMDLLDKDVFTSENVYRHFMGYEALRRAGNKFKADLLGNTLTDKYPFLDIDSLNYKDRSVEEVILAHPERLSQYDLVISALGEPTINLAINQLLIEHGIQTPFIVCFNEPYGVGGHVVTANFSQESCLRCYYSDVVDGTLRPFLGSLVAPGQDFKKSLSGCSSSFVPYSTLDSQQTAIYAVRKSVDVLTRKLTKNDFFTWRGDPTLLESQGFIVSGYFHSTTVPDKFQNPACPICKRRHEEL